MLSVARYPFLIALAIGGLAGRSTAAADPAGDPVLERALAAARDRYEGARRSGTAGDLDAARSLIETAVRDLVALDAAKPDAAAGDLAFKLGRLAQDVGALDASRAALEFAVAQRKLALAEDDPALLEARFELGATLYAIGDLQAARPLLEGVIAARERALPVDHPDIARARGNLALVLNELGDLEGALALQRQVLETFERTLPADDRDVLFAREGLAITLANLGDLNAARTLEEQVLAVYERTLPDDHPDLSRARLNLAATLHELRDLEGALSLKARVVASFERTLPPDHPNLQRARLDLSNTLADLGELAQARALLEGVLSTFERTLSPDHPDLLLVRENLGTLMETVGDLVGARELFERVLAVRAQQFGEDHPDLLRARENLAIVEYRMGDVAGAREIQERVLEARQRTLPADHPDLRRAREGLASTLHAGGDLAQARTLQEQVCAALEAALPDDHPDLLLARRNLAVLMGSQGEVDAARTLLTRVVEACERILPDDHPDLYAAWFDLATALQLAGDSAAARTLFERVLAGFATTFPPESPYVLATRENLVHTLAALGDHAGMRAQLAELTSGLLTRTAHTLSFAPREAREMLAADAPRVGLIASLAGDDGDARRRLFELIETRRAVASQASRVAGLAASDTQLAPLISEARRTRQALSDLVSGAHAREEIRAELDRLATQRDVIERKIARALAERGVSVGSLDADSLAAALKPNCARIGFAVYPSWSVEDHRARSGADRLLAHVLRSDGRLARVDLGTADEFQDVIAGWRQSVGTPLATRGVAAGTEPHSDARTEHDAGTELREKLLDPLLAAAGADIRTLLVCPDDFVFLVPLDALPDGTGHVGDRIEVIVEPSFAALARAPSGSTASAALVALGDIDYGAAVDASEGASASGSAPLGPALRSGGSLAFTTLVGTEEEVRSIAALYRSAFDLDASTLLREQATKLSFAARAPTARYLHVATHGWFAPEHVRSTEDARPTDDRSALRERFDEHVLGFAPMTLCGIALAGANRGADALGRVPGILTAEELCSIDLSRCELAVLSACETNVGVRRAGQGIQSLQAALHAAGARNAVTSLWKVDDSSTKELMERFYTNLWLGKLPAPEALWLAKRALRDAGHPVRDWGAWSLSRGSDGRAAPPMPDGDPSNRVEAPDER